MLAFLDCSKCCERVGQALAENRAREAGLRGRGANMVLDTYGGHRHVKAHGAVAPLRTGGHGLVVGCAFAKDILEACLAPIKTECLHRRQRNALGPCTRNWTG